MRPVRSWVMDYAEDFLIEVEGAFMCLVGCSSLARCLMLLGEYRSMKALSSKSSSACLKLRNLGFSTWSEGKKFFAVVHTGGLACFLHHQNFLPWMPEWGILREGLWGNYSLKNWSNGLIRARNWLVSIPEGCHPSSPCILPSQVNLLAVFQSIGLSFGYNQSMSLKVGLSGAWPRPNPNSDFSILKCLLMWPCQHLKNMVVKWCRRRVSFWVLLKYLHTEWILSWCWTVFFVELRTTFQVYFKTVQRSMDMFQIIKCDIRKWLNYACNICKGNPLVICYPTKCHIFGLNFKNIGL